MFQMCVVFQLVLIAREAMRPGDYWYTWICFGKDHYLQKKGSIIESSAYFIYFSYSWNDFCFGKWFEFRC
jgi:hypothetical protein